jgi:hypothetical protein
MTSDVLLDLLKEFSLKQLLHWLEVCSLLGELRNALLALDAAQKALDVCHSVYNYHMILIWCNRRQARI